MTSNVRKAFETAVAVNEGWPVRPNVVHDTPARTFSDRATLAPSLNNSWTPSSRKDSGAKCSFGSRYCTAAVNPPARAASHARPLSAPVGSRHAPMPRCFPARRQPT